MPKLPDEIIADAEKYSWRRPFRNRRYPKGPGRVLKTLGPGIVTGAADDDPSGIATYSQAGAQFGYQMPWLLPVTYPLMTAVQEACMRIGAVTGKGLAAVIREHYPKRVLYPVVLLVVAANTFNIGSDIGAMAAAARLLLPNLPFGLLSVFFAFLILLFEIFIPYRTYIKILKWLALALFSYIVTAFLVNVPWSDVLRATFIPHFQFNREFLFIVIAIFGTTISPYLFFWETSNVVEDEIAHHRMSRFGGVPRLSRRYLKSLRIDTAVGMLLSVVTAWFIIVVGAVVLNKAGITNIQTSADAAKALEPLVQGFPHAGLIAKVIFAVGIIGVGMQSIPVLAGSSAYAIAESFNWREGLFRKFKQAREFYLIIMAGTLIGLLFNFIGFDPIKALIYTAVFNGIAAVPLIYFITRISANEDIMGEYKNGRWSKLGLWAAFVVMAVFGLALLASFIF